jgi:hypothetical protein
MKKALSTKKCSDGLNFMMIDQFSRIFRHSSLHYSSQFYSFSPGSIKFSIGKEMSDGSRTFLENIFSSDGSDDARDDNRHGDTDRIS